MIKKKSILTFVLAICLIIATMFVLTACGEDKGGSKEQAHTHTYSTEWAKNETHHWHGATCEHTEEKSGYEVHTFGAWEVKTPAGLHQNRVEERKCSICEYVEEQTITGTETHTYATAWSRNNSQHWKESTCEGHNPALKIEVADHDFGGWEEVTPADYGVNKVEKRICSVCEFEEKREVENSALAPKANNISVGAINFTYSGNPNAITVTANNEVNMVVKYEGINGTDYEESTTAPTNAGSYRYTITIPATVEWAKGEKTGEFEISKYFVTCPSIFVSNLVNGQTSTNVLCEIDLTDDENINLDEVILTYSGDSIGAGRMNVKTTSILIDNANVGLKGLPNNGLIEWVIKDENNEFSFRITGVGQAGVCYIGTIQQGAVEVGDKMIVVGLNASNNPVMGEITITKIEYNEKYTTNYKTTSVATSGEVVKITFTKHFSTNLKLYDYIVDAQDMGVINQYQKSQSTTELSFGGSEYRVFALKIDTTNSNKLTITNLDTCAVVKVYNAKTGEEITLTDNKFQFDENTDILILIKQNTSKGTHQVKVETVEYSLGA